jgi:ABC-2 type transport system permease protein
MTNRTTAVIGKELRDYARNRLVIYTMTVLPVVFLVVPTIQLLRTPATVASTALTTRVGLSLLYLLLLPTILPATLAAWAVVGERDQGTLEPVLTTPVRRGELLLGKALAMGIPTLVIAYAMYGVFLTLAALFAQSAIRSAVFTGTHILVQIVFTPLLASWSIWAGISISTRASDVRVAQQLSVLASLPPLAITTLLSFNVISYTLPIALALAAGLLVLAVAAWRVADALFDRERLITGQRQ